MKALVLSFVLVLAFALSVRYSAPQLEADYLCLAACLSLGGLYAECSEECR